MAACPNAEVDGNSLNIMDTSPDITVLRRPRLRIAWGEPGEDGSGWKTTTPLPAMKLRGAYPQDVPGAQVKALAGERELCVRFECQVESRAALRPRRPQVPIAQHEHVFCEIMPHNDPTNRWRIMGTFLAGAMEVSHRRVINGEAALGGSYDLWSQDVSTGAADHDIQSLFGVEAEYWWMEFIVPWRSLGLSQRPPVIGFEYGRAAAINANDPFLLFFEWPDGNRASKCPPNLESGEALLGPDAGAPGGVALPHPCFGRNRGTIEIGNNWPKHPASLRVSVEAPDSAVQSRQEYSLTDSASSVAFEYYLGRDQSSHLDLFRTSTLVLELLGQNYDELFYRARLPFDRHLGICVDEPYGSEAAPAASGTVRERWLERVVRRLPKLARQTTAQGAASDFCLVYENGSIAVNLMANDPWKPLVAIVEQRFHNAEDRLVAAMALIGQKSVTNLLLDPMFFNLAGAHCYHSPHHELMGPLSIMRYGGGSAVCRAAVLAGLLQRLTDPATGQPFTTRILSLSAEGGPRQAGRRYAAGTSLAPFGQEPGRVGAVAVDYGGSQTLLDPTALAFFPLREGALATLEQILADETLRKQGADGLAEVYGKLDVEEIRRQPVNRLLSKGVFPELCPDEDGVDRPFDPRQKQVLRTLTPGCPAEGLMDARGNRGTRNGNVRVTADDRGLSFIIDIEGVDLRQFNTRDRECERAHVVIDAAHSHEQFHHFAVSLAGERKAWRETASSIQTLFKHLSTEAYSEICELPNTDWAARLEREDHQGYALVFEISWEALGFHGANRPGMSGINAWVDGRFPEYEQVFLSPPRWRSPADPFSFADIYLRDNYLRIEEIDLGVPCWGANQLEAVLVNDGPHDALVTLHAETQLSMKRHVHRSAGVTITVPAHDGARAAVPFYADPEEKMTAGQLLRLIGTSDSEWFRATWRMTYCGPINVYHRYGTALGEVANPQPGSPDFVKRKIEFICSRLPDFERRTTRDGAASDFVIQAIDGSVQVNLMEAGALDHLAEFVIKRFDNDFDRLLGLFYLKCHPAIMRHASAGHRFLQGCAPLSILRGSFAGGSGNCGYNGPAFAGMASHLQLNGQALVAHTLTVFRHVINAVGWNGGKVLMDADVGHIFLKADGSDFATIDDIRSDGAILSTAGPGELGRYLSFHDSYVFHGATPNPKAFPGVFPPDSPVD